MPRFSGRLRQDVRSPIDAGEPAGPAPRRSPSSIGSTGPMHRRGPGSTEESVIAIRTLGFRARRRDALRDARDTEEPLRAELFGIEQLKRHAVELAALHRIDPRRHPARLLPRLPEHERVLRAAHVGVR